MDNKYIELLNLIEIETKFKNLEIYRLIKSSEPLNKSEDKINKSNDFTNYEMYMRSIFSERFDKIEDRIYIRNLIINGQPHDSIRNKNEDRIRIRNMIIKRELKDSAPDKIEYILKQTDSIQNNIKYDILRIVRERKLHNEYDLIYKKYFQKIKQLQDEFGINNNL